MEPLAGGAAGGWLGWSSRLPASPAVTKVSALLSPCLLAPPPSPQIAKAVAAGYRPPVPPRDRQPGADRLPPDIEGGFLRLMGACWAQDPGARPSFEQAAAALRWAAGDGASCRTVQARGCQQRRMQMRSRMRTTASGRAASGAPRRDLLQRLEAQLPLEAAGSAAVRRARHEA